MSVIGQITNRGELKLLRMKLDVANGETVYSESIDASVPVNGIVKFVRVKTADLDGTDKNVNFKINHYDALVKDLGVFPENKTQLVNAEFPIMQGMVVEAEESESSSSITSHYLDFYYE